MTESLSSTTDLPDRMRKASSVKTRYDVWRDDIGGWVRVLRKQYDRDTDELVLTVSRGEPLRLRGSDRIRSRRVMEKSDEGTTE